MEADLMRLLLTAALLNLVLISTSQAQEGRVDPEKWVHESEAALAGAESYTAIFHKQEVVNNKTLAGETILLKFRKPFKVYMKWIKEPYKGREILYVDGWNGNRLRAHESGVLGLFTVNLDPKGSMAMKGNRHPVTDLGLANVTRKIGHNLRKGLKNGEVELKDLGNETVYGRKTTKIEAIYPRDKSKGYYCYRAVLNLDCELKVPIKIQIFDWDDKMVESYGYENLKLGAGLTDSDFDPKNPDYKF
jgi:outer membrane lipoprotein-sorting protein